MLSRWSDSEAQRCVDSYARKGVAQDLALCVYATRLLGQDPRLVLHGGGNTSVKTTSQDLLGAQVQVLRVKGSGWDMAAIEPQGLPAVRLQPLLELRDLDELRDEDMVNFERSNLLDSSAPTPSIETLTHAFLPHKFINHTHSAAVLSLTNQPDGEALSREVFNHRMGLVPYIKPGFALAKEAADVFERQPDVDGLILLKHGIFTFAETAREAYERMIEAVNLVERRLERGRKPVFVPATLPKRLARLADVAPVLRGACSLGDSESGRHKPFVLEFRSTPEVLAYVNGEELARYSQAGVATPDHTIRTKNWPLLVPAPRRDQVDAFKRAVESAVAEFEKRCHAYFERHSSQQDESKTELDPRPRVVLVPGLGLFGLGRSARDAMVAADIAESTVETVTAAEGIGRFESVGEADLFDIEYWSLEQAKLSGSHELPLTGHVVLVTGGGGAIGAATAEAFSRQGAEVAILDLNEPAAQAACERIVGTGIAVVCDVTDSGAVRGAFDTVCETFGGVDVVVSNAGAAWQGKIGEVSQEVLRASFELNFFAHQTVAQNAVRVMRAQGTGGVLLFNVSKQAINPGPDFGPYGLAKAATLQLVRQYALDHGREGIRANAVNADRVRSGVLTPEMIAARAQARGVSEEEYMSGNLLRREVTPVDVAQAFVNQALQMKTTANVTTVDGGNISAALR